MTTPWQIQQELIRAREADLARAARHQHRPAAGGRLRAALDHWFSWLPARPFPAVRGAPQRDSSA
ncbi:hypothetical protein AB0F81_35220 [Actinoplanes sp. NPDC024001]|uniref:hypothetical protein n=1 Tax=Actinoplanes sp. NPDC024001 TaxID=3154598 RepID=UPI0033FCB559